MILDGSIQIARYTSAQWTTWDGVLLPGQMSIVSDAASDAVRFKIGDGSTTWTLLPFFNPASTSQTLAQTLGFGNTTGANDIIYSNQTATTVPYLDSNKKLVSSAVTPTELGFLTGVTTSIQAQLNAKLTRVLASGQIFVGNASNVGAAVALSLSGSAGSFGLSNSGVLTMPDAATAARGLLNATDWNTFNNKEGSITAGTTSQYWRGDKSFQTLDTLAVTENTNLYFTNARGIASTLTGYTSGAGTVSASDSILTAIQKLNGNISALPSYTFSTGLTNTANTITSNLSTGISGGQTAIGGTGVGDALNLKGTSGNGTSSVAAINFLVGNNGATTAMSVYNNGNVNLGNASVTGQRIFQVGQDTAFLSFGSLVGSTGSAAMYANQTAPSSTNYVWFATSSQSFFNATTTAGIAIADSTKLSITSTLMQTASTLNVNIGNKASTTQQILRVGSGVSWADFGETATSGYFGITFNTLNPTSGNNYSLYGNGTSTYLNCPGGGLVVLQENGNTFFQAARNHLDFTPVAISGGSVVPFGFTVPNNTAQTASAARPQFLVTNGTTQWATGAGPSHQPFYKITQPTISAVGSSTFPLVSTFYLAGAPNSGSNMIQTVTAGLYIDTAAVNGTGTAGTSFGAYINAMTGATTNNYALGIAGNILINGAYNFILDTTTGTKIGTATSQKLAFFNSTPIVQPANTVAIDDVLINTGLRASGGSANFTLKITNNLPQNLKGYTVATLPAGVTGDIAYVTDALAPSFLVTIVGGGAVVAPVFYDGTNWKAI